MMFIEVHQYPMVRLKDIVEQLCHFLLFLLWFCWVIFQWYVSRVTVVGTYTATTPFEFFVRSACAAFRSQCLVLILKRNKGVTLPPQSGEF